MADDWTWVQVATRHFDFVANSMLQQNTVTIILCSTDIKEKFRVYFVLILSVQKQTVVFEKKGFACI